MYDIKSMKKIPYEKKTNKQIKKKKWNVDVRSLKIALNFKWNHIQTFLTTESEWGRNLTSVRGSSNAFSTFFSLTFSRLHAFQFQKSNHKKSIRDAKEWDIFLFYEAWVNKKNQLWWILGCFGESLNWTTSSIIKKTPFEEKDIWKTMDVLHHFRFFFLSNQEKKRHRKNSHISHF